MDPADRYFVSSLPLKVHHREEGGNTCLWNLDSLLFSTLLLMGVPEKTFQKLEVFINLSLIHVLTLFAYILLHVSYRRPVAKTHIAHSHSCDRRKD